VATLAYGLGVAQSRYKVVKKPETCSVASQSQCTYTWWTENPRFKSLAEHIHG